MKLQKKISNTLFALLLCDLPCEGQQVYELNVSFKEIDDFKIGLHILLFLLIACVAKKTYNLISR